MKCIYFVCYVCRSNALHIDICAAELSEHGVRAGTSVGNSFAKNIVHLGAHTLTNTHSIPVRIRCGCT